MGQHAQHAVSVVFNHMFYINVFVLLHWANEMATELISNDPVDSGWLPNYNVL